ncbi:MAG: glutaredoxin family protein [Rubrivivax sp.]
MSLTSASFAPGALRTTACALAMAGVALSAAAQYKVVAPDGRITYTDRPTSDPASRVTPLSRQGMNEVAPQDPLPPDLRQLAARFPVTLYSTADCAPCEAGRQLLVQRGVPFSEKRILTEDDIAALERVIGARTVPALTIGAQGLRGLSPAEWSAYLDIAGYPRESRLPRGWQPPAATPMVERSPPRAAAAAAASAPSAAATPPAPERTPAPLPGLRF